MSEARAFSCSGGTQSTAALGFVARGENDFPPFVFREHRPRVQATGADPHVREVAIPYETLWHVLLQEQARGGLHKIERLESALP